MNSMNRCLFGCFTLLLLLPKFHQQACTLRAFEDVQVVERGKGYIAGSFDQTFENGRIGTSFALRVGVVSKNVLLKFLKQKRVVVAVKG